MSIICGTDLSAASAGALEVAVALASKRGDTEVVVVHVIDPARGDADAAHEAEHGDARAALEAQVAGFAASGVALRTELVIGPAAETLAGLAETERADLVVLAARSHQLSLLRLGTTTTQVLHRAHVPVVIVRDPAPWLAFARGERPLRVVVGMDDSATCDLGVQWTHALRTYGPVDVVLGAVYYPDDAAAHYGLHHQTMVDRDPEIERLMERDLVRRFGGDGRNVVARPRRGLGRIGDHVVELAQEERADVIIVGTGQKTGLGRLGSVSSVVVNDASQSVVCVPPQAEVQTRCVPVMRSALVATDLSQFANRAVAYAFAVVDGGAQAEVHILHVVKPDERFRQAEIADALTRLAPPGAAPKVTAHVLHGADAAATIAQTAARLGVDVICLASHGRSGLSRALVGSVADQLLRATRLPVLVLRPA